MIYCRILQVIFMNKFTLVTAILQLVSGLVLIGISIYYYTVSNINNFVLFLVVGIIFAVLPFRTFYKLYKSKKNGEGQEVDGGEN